MKKGSDGGKKEVMVFWYVKMARLNHEDRRGGNHFVAYTPLLLVTQSNPNLGTAMKGFVYRIKIFNPLTLSKMILAGLS